MNGKTVILFIIFCSIAVNVFRVKAIKRIRRDSDLMSGTLESDAADDSARDDDFDYDDPREVEVSDHNGNRILVKLLDIHDKNKNVEIVKNVQNMNQTMSIIARLFNISAEVTNDLLTTSETTKLVELFFEIDIQVDCLLALVRVVKAVKREELWAFKCKNRLLFNSLYNDVMISHSLL